MKLENFFQSRYKLILQSTITRRAPGVRYVNGIAVGWMRLEASFSSGFAWPAAPSENQSYLCIEAFLPTSGCKAGCRTPTPFHSLLDFSSLSWFYFSGQSFLSVLESRRLFPSTIPVRLPSITPRNSLIEPPWLPLQPPSTNSYPGHQI